MANLTITTDLNSITVDFGVLSSYYGFKKSVFRKDKVTIASLMDGSDVIKVEIGTKENYSWLVSYDDQEGAAKIDYIDSVAPTSIDDLFTLLKDIIK